MSRQHHKKNSMLPDAVLMRQNPENSPKTTGQHLGIYYARSWHRFSSSGPRFCPHPHADGHQILSLYAKGITTREIVATFKEMYDADVSPTLISKVTDAVKEQVTEWQNRPLDAL